jgi:hypothetical protein
MFAERRHKMSRYKFIAISALITLAFGVTLISDALAGEKVKGRNTYYTTKWQQIPVGDEEGHVIALWESKSITTIFQGKAIPDGLVGRTVGSIDMGKTGVRYLHYINEFTDKDGDKIYCGEGTSPGKWVYLKGTGKFEGIRGGGSYKSYQLNPQQSYGDWEAEVELPNK